ncbi:MAG: FecR domain-containing protein [Tannerella sp.]|jgi:ferric-dicitrate binding protein FerR (iron transport regulator)|nr:FecR domain-containing protein [Tannerella sp.]
MEINRNILISYFLGECSDEEKTAIKQWLASDEAHKQMFISERIRFDASVIVDEDSITSYNVRTTHVGTIFRNMLKIAAAVSLLVISSYTLWLYRSSHAAQKSMLTIHVPAGNRTSLTLPDGSLVWLNSNTTLIYPGVFAGNERSVELNGEAYFEIKKSDKQSFVVKTAKYNAKVLGTTFNIEAYSNTSDFATALFTGKVKLYKDLGEDKSLYLNAGETARLVSDTLQVSPTDVNSYRWKEGLIIIEDKSFEEIMILFGKYFDNTIVIRNNNVKKLAYRGKLRIADGVDHALRVLQKDFSFTYKRDEDTNTIYIY